MAHLAAVSFAPDASADPGEAFAVAIRGTASILESARVLKDLPAVLVTGSIEVYGPATFADLPLSEDRPLRARSAYGLSKIAQESIAIAYADRYDLKLVVTRAFNHIGPVSVGISLFPP
jgi:GDP-4-dehydro-6-deoxy-D-mannose reductase